MEKNNYTHNQYGVSISIDLYRNSAGYSFNEIILVNFERLKNGKWFYKDWGNLKYSPNANLTEFEIRGYSQGDSAIICIDKKQFKEVMGANIDMEFIKEYSHNLFYDNEVSGTIKINDSEIEVLDFISDTFLDDDSIKKECVEYVRKNFNKEISEEFEIMMKTYTI